MVNLAQYTPHEKRHATGVSLNLWVYEGTRSMVSPLRGGRVIMHFKENPTKTKEMRTNTPKCTRNHTNKLAQRNVNYSNSSPYWISLGWTVDKEGYLSNLVTRLQLEILYTFRSRLVSVVCGTLWRPIVRKSQQRVVRNLRSSIGILNKWRVK